MRKTSKIITPLICVLVITVIGIYVCRSINSPAVGQSKPACGAAVQNTITEDEKEFLIRNSVNEGAVRKGEFRDWQIGLIYEYRECMAYLNNKYPDHGFAITTYEWITGMTKKFLVIPDENENNVFAVYYSANGQITDTMTVK